MAFTRRSTDFGTVVLHLMLMITFVVLVATGLRLATDDPEAGWLSVLDAILPVEGLWFDHLVGGVVLAAALSGYAIYMRRARLQARVRLDRARLVAMLQPGRQKWAAVNIAVYWLLMLSLVIEVATGVMLFAEAGRGILIIHLYTTFVCIVAVAAHVALHAVAGGLSQIVRIVRPAPLVLAPPPPDIAELLARELARRTQADGNDASGPQAKPVASVVRNVRLQASPLATAVVVALAVGGAAIGSERLTRPVLRVVEITQAEAPILDGDISDPVWARTTPVSVLTTQGGDFGGTHQSRVEIRALHDGVNAYFSFVWDDPTRSLKHMPLVKKQGRWYVAASKDDMTDEETFNEDKFAALFARPGFPLIGAAIHLARAPLAEHPPSSTGRGLHYAVGGGIADVWQWRASHGGVVGHIDNCHFGAPQAPEDVPRNPGYQYPGGFALDRGTAGYSSNFAETKDAAGRAVVLPRWLPRDVAAVAAALGRVGAGQGESESPGARWWMKASETQPYSPETDATIPDGSVIPSIVVPDVLEPHAASVRGTARWASGRWTLELTRRLYSGSTEDVPVKTGVLMWVAAFDHAEKRHTRHLRPFRLEVE